MENISQTKRTNWAMIIILVVLVPILLLGYKFFSKKIDGTDAPQITSNHAPEQNTGFPLTGDWYYKNTGAELKYVNDKYNFSIPEMVNGVLKGQVTMTMEWMESVKTMSYEVISDRKLKITEPGNAHPPYEMDYVYNAASQTLEIADQGHGLIYTRTPAAGTAAHNNSSSAGNAANTQQGNSVLKAEADKLTRGKWQKYDDIADRLTTITFSAPTFENGSYTGESVKETSQPGSCHLKEYRKYYIMPGGKYKTQTFRTLCDGKEDPSNNGQVSELLYELYTDNNGNQALAVGLNAQELASAVPYRLK